MARVVRSAAQMRAAADRAFTRELLKIGAGAHAGARGGAELIYAEAQARAPRASGQLAGSGEVSETAKGARVAFAVPYAGYVEQGTSDTPAQPFLGPAADAKADAAADVIATMAKRGSRA